jgi:hypothetical protein
LTHPVPLVPSLGVSMKLLCIWFVFHPVCISICSTISTTFLALFPLIIVLPIGHLGELDVHGVFCLLVLLGEPVLILLFCRFLTILNLSKSRTASLNNLLFFCPSPPAPSSTLKPPCIPLVSSVLPPALLFFLLPLHQRILWVCRSVWVCTTQ